MIIITNFTPIYSDSYNKYWATITHNNRCVTISATGYHIDNLKGTGRNIFLEI